MRGLWQTRLLQPVVGSGAAEDPDFNHRFRHQRCRRWAKGIRNGMGFWSLIRFHTRLSNEIRFHGVPVEQSPNQATYRVIEDVWMRGEYDLPGTIPRVGWRVVDVGANAGVYAMLAASRGATVVAYEPAPDAFERLRRNTVRWGVECHHAAVVGAPRTEVRLFLHPLRDTRNTLFGADGGIRNKAGATHCDQIAFERSVVVPAVCITDVLATSCDLLKVACEGAEFEIFAHAAGVLRQAARIILELHAEMRTEYGGAPDLAQTIHDAGFDVRLWEPYPGTSRRFLTAIRY